MRTLKTILPAILAVTAAAFGVHRLLAIPGDAKDSITVDGLERTYRLHVPPSYDGNHAVPLVIALHGRTGTGQAQERMSHLDKVSDEHGFVAIFPDGLERSWADGRGVTSSDKRGINDVKFLSELIAKLENEYKIDPARIYAMGMSNVGFMSARLACDLADKIVAVGIVAASLSTNTAAPCKPAKPVSVLVIQGTKDPLVPYQGGPMGKNGERGNILSHDATIEKFSQLDRCAAPPRRDDTSDQANDGTSIEVVTYSACTAGTEVRGYTVENGGHTWPGGTPYLPAMIIGKTTQNLNGSETIWEFFSGHAR
ncbi:MAG TPA: PHB depolymerase family esterase [Candidatus Acidoferrum sp.]|nr:PHB depolymerase family esterase [Candidatus Acidoferrum sp.]